MTPTDRPVVVAVVGATASGKTDLSLDLAERLGGEIVNTDAMQVYRGMDIGTAKLPAAERRGIPHHLLDVLDIHETASVAEFQRMARAVIDDLRGRGVVPVLVGGSALYTRAVLDRFEFPGTDEAVRRELEDALAADGPAALHARLAAVDAEAAAAILPGNGRRIVRALEVVTITGRPYSSSLPQREYLLADAHQVGVAIDRPTLDERIARRVDGMFDGGFVAEVEALAARGLADTRTASRAIGYPEVLAMLAGELTEAEARERTAAATRRFARRQDSWFHKDDRITWVDHADPDRVDRAIAAIPEGPEQERSGAPAPAGATLGVMPEQGRDRLRELLDAVLDEDNHTLDEMADDAYASPYHFSRQLSRGAGEPPVAMKRRVLLERAAWELRGGATVTDVAFEAGYESVEGFARAFARVVRAPAQRHRRARRQPLAAGAQRDPLPPADVALGGQHRGLGQAHPCRRERADAAPRRRGRP